MASKAINAHEELLKTLTAILENYPPTQQAEEYHYQGLFYGPTSVAYLFLRLSVFYSHLKLNGHHLRHWCVQYLNIPRPDQYISLSRTGPSRCGVGDEGASYLAVRAAVSSDAENVEKLAALHRLVNSDREAGSDEWLYGRAGYLYLLRMVKYFLTKGGSRGRGDAGPNTHAVLDDAISQTANRIMRSPQPWTWHGTAYIGAAHGSIGILTELAKSKPEVTPQLQALLSSLLGLQFSSGNWPTSWENEKEENPRSDRLVQFCHGAPGFAISLIDIKCHFPELSDKIKTAILKGRECIGERGLLRKEPCLCHGVAGNILALMGDGEEEAHIPRIDELLQYMTEEQVKNRQWERSSEPYGLFTGMAGRAWAWSVRDMIESRDTEMAGKVIGYNDL